MIRDLTDEEARRALVLKWGAVEPGVLPAWVAEMDYALAPVVRDALVEAVDVGVTGYPEIDGQPGSARRTPRSPGVTGAGTSIPAWCDRSAT